ncbi:translation initiation factor IF-2-like, partial [Psammomys obesus]|uniref:translation initiation factor IF-2-like n=1 Tax=Psammomys obesus TaxID=48139 RepID=UPI0024528528
VRHAGDGRPLAPRRVLDGDEAAARPLVPLEAAAGEEPEGGGGGAAGAGARTHRRLVLAPASTPPSPPWATPRPQTRAGVRGPDAPPPRRAPDHPGPSETGRRARTRGPRRRRNDPSGRPHEKPLLMAATRPGTHARPVPSALPIPRGSGFDPRRRPRPRRPQGRRVRGDPESPPPSSMPSTPPPPPPGGPPGLRAQRTRRKPKSADGERQGSRCFGYQLNYHRRHQPNPRRPTPRVRAPAPTRPLPAGISDPGGPPGAPAAAAAPGTLPAPPETPGPRDPGTPGGGGGRSLASSQTSSPQRASGSRKTTPWRLASA